MLNVQHSTSNVQLPNRTTCPRPLERVDERRGGAGGGRGHGNRRVRPFNLLLVRRGLVLCRCASRRFGGRRRGGTKLRAVGRRRWWGLTRARGRLRCSLWGRCG